VRFENIDGFDRVSHFALSVDGAHMLDAINAHLGEKWQVRVEDFRRQRRLRGVEQHITAKLLRRYSEGAVDVLHSLFGRNAITTDD